MTPIRHLHLIRPGRPIVRGDCLPGGFNAHRPCHYLMCEWHTEQNESNEKAAAPLVSCILDVADRGGVTLEEVGEALGVTRQRAQQIEGDALIELARKLGVPRKRVRELLMTERPSGVRLRRVES